MGRPEDGQLARESAGHREALKPNVCCPAHGLDNGGTPQESDLNNIFLMKKEITMVND
jgi:hypothetical protein